MSALLSLINDTIRELYLLLLTLILISIIVIQYFVIFIIYA